MINELIQTIGDRAIFLEYWQRNFSRPLTSSENKEKDAQPIFKKRVKLIFCFLKFWNEFISSYCLFMLHIYYSAFKLPEIRL